MTRFCQYTKDTFGTSDRRIEVPGRIALIAGDHWALDNPRGSAELVLTRSIDGKLIEIYNFTGESNQRKRLDRRSTNPHLYCPCRHMSCSRSTREPVSPLGYHVLYVALALWGCSMLPFGTHAFALGEGRIVISQPQPYRLLSWP